MARSVIVGHGDSLARIGLRSIIESREGRLVELAKDFATLTRFADECGEAVSIVDSNLPGMNGIAGLSTFTQSNPRQMVCLVLPKVTRDAVCQSVSHGILACIAQARLAEEVNLAIDALVDGRMYFSKAARDLPESKTTDMPTLTCQQLKVLQSMATGKSNKQVARELGICEGTVKVHLNAAYRALGVVNRVAAVSKLRELNKKLASRSFGGSVRQSSQT